MLISSCVPNSMTGDKRLINWDAGGDDKLGLEFAWPYEIFMQCYINYHLSINHILNICLYI